MSHYTLIKKELQSNRPVQSVKGGSMNWRFLSFLRRKKKRAAQEVPVEGYVCRLGTEEVILHNTLMNGVTSTRGKAMGFIQEDRLVLGAERQFSLTKELKSTKTNLLMKDPVKVTYVFTGTYERDGEAVLLSKAAHGKGSVSWGTISRFLDTGDGEYDSIDSPGILSLYPTPFFVERCKNVPMKVFLNEEEKTFKIESFEPVILSREEAGIIERKTQALDPQAGLMKKDLLPDRKDLHLKERFDKLGMKIGTCINPAYTQSPYKEILTEQFSSVTLENHLKPLFTLDQAKSKATGKASVSFSPETVSLLDFCKRHQMPFRGHTLIWYLGTPEWVFHEGFETDAANVGKEELVRRMEDYIRGFFEALSEGGWSDLMYCIDVVNEAIIAPDQMRKCAWEEIIGDEYLKTAYTFARKYAPAHVKLAYNDFDLETKTDKVIEVVNSLTSATGEKLVDVVGQQGHYGAYSSLEPLAGSLKKIYEKTGCEIQITELDVSVSRLGTEEELKRQGRFYAEFMDTLLRLQKENVPITGLTLWGFADALSWMPSGYLHIYDRNLVPKYAYYALMGMNDLAGFDETEQDGLDESAETVRALFEIPGKPERYISLKPDGTYVDTLRGEPSNGKYRSNGSAAFMLIPATGSYSELTIEENGTARLREAAGGLVDLVIKEDMQ